MVRIKNLAKGILAGALIGYLAWGFYTVGKREFFQLSIDINDRYIKTLEQDKEELLRKYPKSKKALEQLAAQLQENNRGYEKLREKQGVVIFEPMYAFIDFVDENLNSE